MANKRVWWGMLVMVLVFGMLAVGCGNSKVTRENYDMIRTGMTFDQVREIMGKAKSVDETDVLGDTLICWYYETHSSLIQIAFDNGKVFSKSWDNL